MCTVTTEACEVKAAVGPIESGCGGTKVALVGANSEQGDSEPPTPKKSTLALPKLIKKEDEDEDADDPLTSLVTLFGLTALDDSDDSDDGSDYDSEDDAPPSPRSKGFDKLYFYAASGRVLYYDSFRNVYLEDGTLVHDGSFDFPLNELFSPSFYIDGVPYQFDLEGLLSNDIDGTPYRVLTWQNEPELLDLSQLVGQTPQSQNDTAIFSPNLNSGSFYGVEHTPMTMPTANEYYTALKTKAELLSPSTNPNSLQQALQGGSKPLTWSPTSSAQKSPIVSTASREPSMGPPLFSDPEPGRIAGIPIISKWQHEVTLAQKDSEKARSPAKPNKEDRRRCPICNKMFRRPSSLDDHLNVHSGDKPHICPFKGCNTGFATKSNMKRHFDTHRVGKLERYRPGAACQPNEAHEAGPTRPGKISRPISTYNSKSYHNGRFRVSAV